MTSCNRVFCSGGIGDVIAIESFFSMNMRENLETIYLASRANKEIVELFKSLPNYPKLTNYHVLWNDFSQFPCFLHKYDLNHFINDFPDGWDDVEDWGILSKFPPEDNSPTLVQRMTNKQLGALEQLRDVQKCLKEYLPKDVLSTYNQSSFIKHKLCDITHELPDKYVVLFPHTSTPGTPATRNASDAEWFRILNYLEEKNLVGVILGNFDYYMPVYDHIINLNKKTSVIEAIEIAKGADGYIGVDSFLTVVVTKVCKPENIMIKCINPHCYRYKSIYFAPNTTFDFMVRYIEFK